MKKLIGCLLIACWGVPVLAFNPLVAEPSEVYAPIIIEGDPYHERQYLGTLEDFPDLYELTTDVGITLTLQLSQRNHKAAVPFGIIMVRQNDADGGVTEIFRSTEQVSELVPRSYNALGMSLLEGSVIRKEITPGTYRIEVSTPDNQGAYMLRVGDETVSASYGAKLLDIYHTQRHFGFLPFRVFLSSYVYYPLGIVLVLYGIYETIRYRRGKTLWLCRFLKRS